MIKKWGFCNGSFKLETTKDTLERLVVVTPVVIIFVIETFIIMCAIYFIHHLRVSNLKWKENKGERRKGVKENIVRKPACCRA